MASILYLIITIWSASALVWYILTRNRGRLKIYPLVLLYESQLLMDMIEGSGRKRKLLWGKIGAFSDEAMPIFIILSTVYIVANMLAILKGALIISYDVPLGSEFIVVVPFVTARPSWGLLIILLSFIPAILLHEFFHGAVSVSQDIGIKSAGCFIMLGIVGGYVEPCLEGLWSDNDIRIRDRNLVEGPKKLDNHAPSRGARRIRKIMAAGILANVILAGFFFGALHLMELSGMFSKYGVEVIEVEQGSAADVSGIQVGDIIVRMNRSLIKTLEDFVVFIRRSRPGDTVAVYLLRGANEVVVYVVLGERNGRAYMGVAVRQYIKSNIPQISDRSMFYVYTILYVNFLVEFLVAMINSLPCFVLDGAQWLRVVLKEKMGSRGTLLWTLINVVITAILIMNFIAPVFARYCIK